MPLQNRTKSATSIWIRRKDPLILADLDRDEEEGAPFFKSWQTVRSGTRFYQSSPFMK